MVFKQAELFFTHSVKFRCGHWCRMSHAQEPSDEELQKERIRIASQCCPDCRKKSHPATPRRETRKSHALFMEKSKAVPR